MVSAYGRPVFFTHSFSPSLNKLANLRVIVRGRWLQLNFVHGASPLGISSVQLLEIFVTNLDWDWGDDLDGRLEKTFLF
jgi:hypothetical protein